MSGPSAEEARSFAAAFRSFLDWVHAEHDGERDNEVVALIADALGADGAAHSVAGRSFRG